MGIRSWNDDGSELRVPTYSLTTTLVGTHFTVAALVKPRSKADWEAIMAGRDLVHTRSAWNFGMSSTDTPFYEYINASNASQTFTPATGGVLSDDQWYIIAYSSNVITHHFHIYDLTAATWVHLLDNFGPGLMDSAGPSAFVEFGRNITYGFQLNAVLAVAAIWNVGLTDGEVEGLSENLASADWVNLDKPPVGLWSFTQDDVAEPVFDIMGNHETIVGTITSDTDLVGRTGTTLVTTEDPPGWDLTVPPPVLDFEIRFSGGASNESPNDSFGGAMSSAAAYGLFDSVSSTQALVGMVDYRLVYVLNNESAADATIEGYVSDQVPGVGHEIALGLATEPAGTEVAALPNDTSAPPGVTFSAPTTLGTAVDLGAVGSEQMKGVWLRRTTPAASPDSTTNPWEVTIVVTPVDV